MNILSAANTSPYGTLLISLRAASLAAAAILSGFFLPVHSYAQGQSLTVLPSHGNLAGPLVEAPDGNLYGEYTGGQIFQLTPGGSVNVIYTFNEPVQPTTHTNADGIQPDGGLLLGKDGNLYGTTYQGGANGYGTVFRLTTGGALTTLASFTIEGYTHPGPLVEDSHGNLYGVTETGGNVDEYRTDGYGYVFEVTAAGQLGTVHLFTAPGAGSSYDPNTYDGAEPMSGLAITSTDIIYGTTTTGGTNTTGTVFEFGSGGGGFAVIYNFDPAENGTTPSLSGTGATGPLAVAKDDSVYGTTEAGGAGFSGAVFKISGEAYSVIYSFSAVGQTGNTNSDGAFPHGISVGNDGNLYGTTTSAGPNGAGTIYQLTPSGNLTVLYSFTSGQTDGELVEVPPLEASNGNVYGGGPVNMGNNALYELEPPPSAVFQRGGQLKQRRVLPRVLQRLLLRLLLVPE